MDFCNVVCHLWHPEPQALKPPSPRTLISYRFTHRARLQVFNGPDVFHPDAKFVPQATFRTPTRVVLPHRRVLPGNWLRTTKYVRCSTLGFCGCRAFHPRAPTPLGRRPPIGPAEIAACSQVKEIQRVASVRRLFSKVHPRPATRILQSHHARSVSCCWKATLLGAQARTSSQTRRETSASREVPSHSVIARPTRAIIEF